MAAVTTRSMRGGAGGSGDAGGKADDAVHAAVAVFPAGGVLALAAGIDDAEFNVKDFLATLDAFGRRRGRRRSRAVGAVLCVWEGDRTVTALHMTMGGEDACERAPLCARTSALTGESGSVRNLRKASEGLSGQQLRYLSLARIGTRLTRIFTTP